jgi:hypothetical protein
MKSTSFLSRLYTLFFAEDDAASKRLRLWQQYLIIFLLFFATRAVAYSVIHARGGDYLANDPSNYIAMATYFEQHHAPPAEDNQSYRQFAGLSLLMWPTNLLVGNMILSGLIVSAGGSILSVFLFHHLFRDFRLSLMFTIFLPWWIAANYTIVSEGAAMACFLVGVWALRDHPDNALLLILGLLVAGFSVVIRQTALFYVYPFIFLYALLQPGQGLAKAVLYSVIAIVPFAAYLAWNWVNIHMLFPQLRMQQETTAIFLSELHHPQWYGSSNITWPFRSLIVGTLDPEQNFWKKLSSDFSVLVALVAVVAMCARAAADKGKAVFPLHTAIAVALFCHVGFHLCVGNVAGFKWQDRYMSQINPLIDYALFFNQPLRTPWIICAALGGTLFAAATGNGGHFLFFK